VLLFRGAVGDVRHRSIDRTARAHLVNRRSISGPRLTLRLHGGDARRESGSAAREDHSRGLPDTG